MSVNPIKGKFIKISNDEAFKAAKLDGSDKEILKVNALDQVILLDLPIVDDGVAPASNVATEAYVDGEITTLADAIGGRIDDHVGGFAERHNAHDIVFTPAGLTTSIDVQAAIEEVQIDATQGISDAAAAQSAINNHLSDSVDAHDASAISVSPIVGLVATDVQAALVEIQGSLGGLSFEASAISFDPVYAGSNLVAIDVQAALEELDSEKVAKAGDSMTGQLLMDHADIFQDYSDVGAGITEDLTLGQGEILSNYTDASESWNTQILAGGETISRTSIGSATSDVSITLTTTHNNNPLLIQTQNYESDYSATVEVSPGSVAFAYDDLAGGASSVGNYGSAAFSAQFIAADGTYDLIEADPTVGISVGHFDGLVFSPKMPTLDFQLTPKKYVDDADAVVAGSISSHLSDTIDAHDASAISSIPAGNLAATDVQAALNELDSEKVKKSGDTMTGTLIINPASGDAADLNGPVVLDTQLKVSHPYGPGYTVMATIDSSADEFYINTADKVGVGLDGTNSKTMGVQSGYVLGATSGQLFLSSGGASGGAGNITGATTLASGGILVGATGATGNIFASTGTSRAGDSGQAIIRSGDAITSGNSGAIGAFSGLVETGNSGSSQLNSGNVTVQGASGNVSVFSGTVSAGTGVSGVAVLGSGATAGGASGSAQLTSGNVANAASTASSGNIVILSGSNTGLGSTGVFGTGAARMRSGSMSNGSAVGDTGIADLFSGNNAGSGKTGDVSVFTGNNTGTGISGDLALRTGTTASGLRGKVAITSRIVEINSQLDMQSNKIIDMAAGSASGDAVEYSQYTTALGLKADKDLSNLVVAPLGAYRFLSDINLVNGFNAVKSEDATGLNNSGGIGFKSGDAISGDSGLVALGSGDSVSGSAGNVVIFSGVGAGSVRGFVQVEASKLNLLNVIDMNSHQINELADGTLAADAVNKGQLDAGLDLKLDLAGGDMTGDINMQNHKILHLTMNTDADCAATKQYVDNVAEGLHVHAPVKLVMASAIAGTYSNGVAGVGAKITPASPIASIDTITVFALTERIMVKGQSNTWENGIYTVSAVDGSNFITELTRASDFDTSTEVAGGDFIFVQDGFAYANSGWVETETTTTLNFGVSDPILFLQFSGAGAYSAGDGLNLDGTVFSVDATDLIGFGVGHDGSNNFRIASEAAGDGIAGGDGVALSVDHDALGLEFIGGQLSLAIDPAMFDKSSGDLQLANTTVTSGSYVAFPSKTASFTVDAQGRLTAASDQDISIISSQISDFTTSVEGIMSVSDSTTVSMTYLAGDFQSQVIYENSTLQVGAGGLAVYHDSSLSHDASGLAIALDGVGPQHISEFVAGNGLGQDAFGALEVKVDNLSIELSVDAVQIKNSGVTESKIADNAVTSLKIAADAVGPQHISEFVAGNGLGQDAFGALEVKVDNLSIELSVDAVQIKNSGVTESKIADNAVTSLKIAADAVGPQHISEFVAGDGLGQDAFGALEVKVGNGLELALDAVKIKLDGTSLSVSASGIKSNIIWYKESYPIPGTVSIGSNDTMVLDFEPELYSMSAYVDRLAIHEGEDYTISGSTVTFIGSLVASGQQQLTSTDTIFFKYQKKAA